MRQGMGINLSHAPSANSIAIGAFYRSSTHFDNPMVDAYTNNIKENQIEWSNLLLHISIITFNTENTILVIKFIVLSRNTFEVPRNFQGFISGFRACCYNFMLLFLLWIQCKEIKFYSIKYGMKLEIYWQTSCNSV